MVNNCWDKVDIEVDVEIARPFISFFHVLIVVIEVFRKKKFYGFSGCYL